MGKATTFVWCSNTGASMYRVVFIRDSIGRYRYTYRYFGAGHNRAKGCGNKTGTKPNSRRLKRLDIKDYVFIGHINRTTNVARHTFSLRDYMFVKEFYQPSEITECPLCGNNVRDPMYPECWHCSGCGFAVCAYYKREIDEIRARQVDAMEKKLRRTTAQV